MSHNNNCPRRVQPREPLAPKTAPPAIPRGKGRRLIRLLRQDAYCEDMGLMSLMMLLTPGMLTLFWMNPSWLKTTVYEP